MSLRSASSSRAGVPEYAWVCHVCEASNAAGQGNCARCGNASHISMAQVAAARSAGQAKPRELPIHWGEISRLLLRLRSALPRPRPIRFEMKKGSAWLCAAGICGAAMLVSGILLWGDGSPQIPGAGAPTSGRSIWTLPDGLGLLLLVAMVFGVPLTGILTFIGLALRISLRAALWTSGCVLLALILIL